MKRKTLFTDEELDLLSDEEDLRDKSPEDLSDEDKTSLKKIDDLRKEIPKRLEELGTPEKSPKTEDDAKKIVLQALSGYWKRQRKAAKKDLAEIDAKGGKPEPKKEGEEKKGEEKKETKLSDAQRDFLLQVDPKKRPDKAEFGLLQAIADRDGISLEEAADTDGYKDYSKSHRAKLSSEEKTPKPSPRSEILGKDLVPGDMTPEEHKEKFGEMKEEITKKLGGKNKI